MGIFRRDRKATKELEQRAIAANKAIAHKKNHASAKKAHAESEAKKAKEEVVANGSDVKGTK